MRSIGETARDSGLTVSALRFYDGADVLGPAWVDPQTGYRWYDERQLADARLLARLRRVGLPLAEIRIVLGARPGAAGEAHRVLDAHLCRLQDGLADARRELSAVRSLLDQREHPMGLTRTATRITVDAAELAAALDAVRFAVGSDPELPVLAGVLFDIDGQVLRLVATDRYRMALSETPVTRLEGEPAGALVPTALADGIRALLAGAERAELVLEDGRIVLTADAHRIEGAALDHDYPDYRRLVRLEPARRVEIAAATLREAVAGAATRRLRRETDGVDCEILVLTVGPDGALSTSDGAPSTSDGAPSASDSASSVSDGLGAEAVRSEGAGGTGRAVAEAVAEAAAFRIAVNREFLLDAVRAGGPDQLVLELGGPIAPLAIRTPGREGTFSMLMPFRLS